MRPAQKSLGVEFDSIDVAVGSGGAYAGLLYGKRIFGPKGNILGINVLDTPSYSELAAGLPPDLADN
jgi:1-aminocyclopropane-1-carboxylate deaminase/D-cysteine desulfhydrase-like pyridoxal-dependent ACC family enzyme